MTPPRSEDFGISDVDILMIKAELQREAERKNRGGGLLFLIVYGLVVAALWPSSGPFALVVGIGPTFFAGIVVGFLVDRIQSWLVPADRRRRLQAYNAFLRAQKDYDSWFVRTQTTFWRSLGGLAFEHEVARLLMKSGITARVTAASNDHGIDLVLGDGTIVQCKQRKNPVGPAIIRELYGALVASRAPRAILISTTGFTPGVHDFARDKPIDLWDHAVLIAMQRKLES